MKATVTAAPLAWLVSFVVISAAPAWSQTSTAWRLAWNDEFNGTAGTPPDPSKWNYNLGAGGWGNGELQTYTRDPTNAAQDGMGNLVIRAKRSVSGEYTSARLLTSAASTNVKTANAAWRYGWIEARIKSPFGKGVWPAFWMLGENIDSVGWPSCGEIDILENFGTFQGNSGANNATANGPGYTGKIGQTYQLPFGRTVADDYHVYAIVWAQDSIEWFLDGVPYYRFTPRSLPPGKRWVFNERFFLLLNVAIAGPTTVAAVVDGADQLMGTPDPEAPFPAQEMLVDYVRVYEIATAGPEIPVILPSGVVNAAAFIGNLAPGSLAALFGANLAGGAYATSPEDGVLPNSIDGVSVSVNEVNAPLLYVSPTQINFQIPWETPSGMAVPIRVSRNGMQSDSIPVTVGPAAPSFFLSEYRDGVVWVTGPGCPQIQCEVHAGGEYVLWGNGFGPKNEPQADGMAAAYEGSSTPLEVPGGIQACALTIGGRPAAVRFCGAARGSIVDQLSFQYPDGVAASLPYVDATLTIAGVTGRFRVPAPQ